MEKQNEKSNKKLTLNYFHTKDKNDEIFICVYYVDD